jgi:hypothetical protein
MGKTSSMTPITVHEERNWIGNRRRRIGDAFTLRCFEFVQGEGERRKDEDEDDEGEERFQVTFWHKKEAFRFFGRGFFLHRLCH